MYEKYKDQVEFFAVYIMEAHTSDGWQTASNLRDKVVFRAPTSFAQRGEVAQSCVVGLKIPFPALLDDFANSTEAAYSGWPDRLYVIGRDGRVAYKSDPGPFGFKPAEVASTLRDLTVPF